ncbi:flavodoxin [Caproiciproducens sp. R2]|uniref:flavodoxin n=1 Tax=Caproiciproducens sp. R2 TaxID=3435187 RepID=UPI004034E923
MSNVYIVYWSGTGNTETMANLIAEGVQQAGGQAEVTAVSDADRAKIESSSVIAFGCPAMGDEVLEESEFEPFFTEIESGLKDKNVALFGSYGWGDGAWMREWQDRVQAAGARLADDGLIVQSTPDADGETQCRELGKSLASL